MKPTQSILLIFLVLMMAACGATPATAEATPIPIVVADNTIISEGRLEPIHYIELGVNTNGLVSEVLISEGDTVIAGDVIARLESSEAQTLESAQAKASQDLTAAYQKVSETQSKLDSYSVPSTFAGMTPAEAVAAMQIKLDKARADFEPYEYLSQKKLQLTDAEENGREVIRGTAKIYKKELDNAWALYRSSILWLELETNLQSANVNLAIAQKDFNALQDPSFSQNTAATRAVLANAEIRAPFPGLVTDLNLKLGEFTSSGQPVMTIADISNWIVKTRDLTEIDVVNIKEGQPVTVKFDALPELEFKGNVLSISNNFSENQGDIVYEVTILLTDTNAAMRWGMTAVVTFK